MAIFINENLHIAIADWHCLQCLQI